MITDAEAEQRRLNAILSTADGREWMWNHLGMCGVFQSTYASNTHDTAFNEGRRSIGLRLLADLQEHTFKLYQSMEKEARERLEQQQNEVTDDDDF